MKYEYAIFLNHYNSTNPKNKARFKNDQNLFKENNSIKKKTNIDDPLKPNKDKKRKRLMIKKITIQQNIYYLILIKMSN